jgi:DegV family protein with EDD domain
MLREGAPATTSAVNVGDYTQALEPLLQQGKDVLVLAFSSALSTTYNSACIALDDLLEKYPQRKAYAVDTLSASMGQGLLVWLAAEQKQQGKTIEEVRDWVEQNKLHLCHEVTVDDLNTLKRGGRISTTTAVVGSMLQIKPIIHVDHHGRVDIPAKAMGLRKGMDYLCKQADVKAPDTDFPLYVMYTDDRTVAETLALRLAEHGHAIHEDHIIQVGAAIGSHIGPKACGLVYVGK